MKKQKLIPLSKISVVHILESADPLAELREYLDRWQGIASIHAGQVALGAAQLMLLDDASMALIDLIVDYWDALPDPNGFHTREFLRNAFAVADAPRLARLLELVPDEPGMELAIAIEEARVALHAHVIAAKVATHVPAVRAALDDAIRAVRDYHGIVELNPPASIDAIIAAERASAVRLPDDYRALLTLTDGMRLWDEAFLGTLDFATATDLSSHAPMDDDLVPLLRAGDDAWLLYDPRRTRYLLRAAHRTAAVRGITEFLGRLAQSARDAESRLN